MKTNTFYPRRSSVGVESNVFGTMNQANSLEEILNNRNKERISYISYYPGGNSTLFIESIPQTSQDRQNLSALTLDGFNNEDEGLQNIEQVGFIDTQQKMLMMTGGEFCGNALRSFAYHLLDGKPGNIKVKMVLGGENKELNAGVMEDGTARAEMPIYSNPNNISLDSENENNYIVEMEGITHYINYEGLPFDKNEEDFSKKIKEYTMEIIKHKELEKYDASGVIYITGYKENIEIVPVVYVPGGAGEEGTLFVETACGSGTTAVALAEAIKNNGSIENLEVLQPSGKSIFVSVTRDENGNFAKATIGGPVSRLSEGTFKSSINGKYLSGRQTSIIIDTCNNQENMDYAMHNGCIQLYQNLFSQPPYEEKFTNEDVINEFEDYFKLNKEGIFFAKDKGKIIGFGVVVPIMNSAVDKVLSEKIVQQGWDKEKCYYMADLGVDPEYQRYSIGTDLVLSRINSLPKGSIIIMRTSLNNYKSQGLYKKLGFQRIEDTIEKVKQERIDGTTTEDERLFLYHIK